MASSILVTGASGYVGTYLTARFAATRADSVDTLQGDVAAGDLSVPAADVVIHLAGKLNSFRGPEAELERANYDGTVNVARRCRPGAHFIFLSTDQVFRSDVARSYTEEDEVAPETCYGRSKARAEAFLLSTMARVTILRTSVVYGYAHPRRENTVEFIESRLRRAEPVELYRDVFTCPTFIGDLCGCIELAIDAGIFGVHHACGPEYLSRCDIGRVLCHARGYEPELIRPVDRPEAAHVPRYVHLRASESFRKTLSTSLAEGLAARESDGIAVRLGLEGV